MKDENKIEVVRAGRSNPPTTLKVQPKTSFDHLWAKIEFYYTEPNGQRAINLAVCQNGNSRIYVEQSEIDEFYKQGYGLFSQQLEKYKGLCLSKLYDMITDKLYETNFKDNTIKFRASELCKLTGNDKSNAMRIKTRFADAARTLHSMNFVNVHHGERLDFRMTQEVFEKKGTIIIQLTDRAMNLFSHMPRAMHDTVLYKLKDNDRCAYSLGRWIENYSIWQARKNPNSFKEVSFSMNAIMSCCSYIPQTLTNSREYAHRIPWLEGELKKLKEIGLIEWEWVAGRPQSLEQESIKQIRCKFKNERRSLGKATQAISD